MPKWGLGSFAFQVLVFTNVVRYDPQTRSMPKKWVVDYRNAYVPRGFVNYPENTENMRDQMHISLSILVWGGVFTTVFASFPHPSS